MSESLGFDGLSDHNYGKTTADKLRAKRLQLMKEKELAFEESKKPTRRDYALEKEMVRERMALKKQFAEEQAQLEAELAAETVVPSTEGLTSDELRELARRQREAINRNSPPASSNTTSQVANTAMGVGVVATSAGVAVAGGAASMFFGWLGKQMKRQNRGYSFKARFGSRRGPWRT